MSLNYLFTIGFFELKVGLIYFSEDRNRLTYNFGGNLNHRLNGLEDYTNIRVDKSFRKNVFTRYSKYETK